jgi:hypothetical protein
MRFKKRSLRPAINLSNCKYEVGKDAHLALQRSSDRRRSLYISILRQGGILVAICHRLNHEMMPLLLIRALVYHRPGRLVIILDLCMKLSWSGSSKSISSFLAALLMLWLETSRSKPPRCVCNQSFKGPYTSTLASTVHVQCARFKRLLDGRRLGTSMNGMSTGPTRPLERTGCCA